MAASSPFGKVGLETAGRSAVGIRKTVQRLGLLRTPNARAFRLVQDLRTKRQPSKVARVTHAESVMDGTSAVFKAEKSKLQYRSSGKDEIRSYWGSPSSTRPDIRASRATRDYIEPTAVAEP